MGFCFASHMFHNREIRHNPARIILYGSVEDNQQQLAEEAPESRNSLANLSLVVIMGGHLKSQEIYQLQPLQYKCQIQMMVIISTASPFMS